ncbi:MAG: pyridine nucleotide-disulfide oxidoreductase [Marinovum sp.]|nr:pyridine nucleotide-disulfide oxidoreductase [Marinovum sp.]
MKIVVVGAGQAGASLVAKLRSSGHQGEITMIGSEPELPYQRPPLSKKYLLGEIGKERLFLRPQNFYDDQTITLALGRSVDAVDRTAKTVTAGDTLYPYDHLVLTTGSSPRHLPKSIGGTLAGVYTMRDLADADAMAPEFMAGRRVLIVGGGYIGLEAAAVAARLGLNVTLVEMSERILQRVAAPQTSDYFRSLHQSHGVNIQEGTGLTQLHSTEGRVSGASLSDGRKIAVDFVIVGVGITPQSDIAKAAGLTVEDGIQVNALGQTSDPAIWAAGDCAVFPYKDGKLRLESVQNAIDQAEAVAGNILGAEQAYIPQPWFWSDQYDVKLQIAGLNTGYDSIVTRAAPDEPNLVSFWYYQGDRLLAVDAMNDPRAYMVGKRLIENGNSPAPAVIADPKINLKSLLKP